jgi:hypothetical protein
MDLFDWLIVLVVAGGAAALWFLYRNPNTVTHEGRTYRRTRDGRFRDAAGAPVTDLALVAALQAEHDRLMKARDARIAQASDD